MPDEDDPTGVGGETIGTTEEEGSETTGSVETDAVNAIDGPPVAGRPEERQCCPAAPDNSEQTAVLTRDANRFTRQLAGIGLDPEDVVTVEVSTNWILLQHLMQH